MSIEIKTRADPKDARYAEKDVPCVILTADDGTYQVVPRAAFDADPLQYVAARIPLDEARKTRLLDLAQIRWEKTQTMVYDGVTTPASPAISALTGAVVAIQSRVPPPTVRWKLAPGEWREYDIAGLIALGTAMREHIQACFDREAELDALIQGAATSKEVMALDLTTGWPATAVMTVP